MSTTAKRSKDKRMRLVKLQDRAQLLFSFGQRLEYLRLKSGLTPSQFEARSGIDAGNLAKYEQGHREPGLLVIVMMARCLGVSLREFFDFEFDGKAKLISKPSSHRMSRTLDNNLGGDPIALLRSLMNQKKMKSKQLAEILGVSPGLVSDMMSYKKGLSKRSIRVLANYFNVDINLFYGESD